MFQRLVIQRPIVISFDANFYWVPRTVAHGSSSSQHAQALKI